MSSLKKRLPALVLLAAVIMAGCAQEEDYTPPEAGVLTVSGAVDGISYEAEVYDWPDAVADAADLTGIMSEFEPDGTGAGIADNGTLEIGLETPDGAAFTSDGKFLVVLVAEDDSAQLKYKAFVRFTGGRAALKYSTMKTATVESSGTDDPNGTDKPSGTDDPNGTDKPSESMYTVTFHTNGGTPDDFTQQVQSGDKATLPTPPTRQGYTFDGWFTSTAYTTKWNFGTDTVTKSITLYGTWTRNTYKVTFNTGDVAPTPEPLPAVPYASTLTEPAMTKTGYTLDGWYKDNAKTTRWDFDKDTVKEEITLYGTWIKNSVVTFFVDGAVNKTVEVPPGSKVGMPNLAAKANHDFDGWYKDEALNTPYNFDSTVSADITLYARWKPLTFAVLLMDMAADAAANTEKTYILPSGSETYTLAITPLTTANSPASVVIDGGGRVVTGSANRITIGEGVTLTLKNITFKKVPFTVVAGATLVLDNGAVVTGNAGAGITVSGESATAKGTLEMKAGASITLNGGGGVALTGTGDNFTMSGGTISGNTASNDGGGGGVALTGTGGTFTMSGGTISGNTGTPAGGGVGLWGTNNKFTITDGGIISGNSTSDNGGGVSVWGMGNEFTMTGGTISGNNANIIGGGVAMCGRDSKFTMSVGTISDNESSRGGGVALWSNSNTTFNMSSGVIKDNIVSVHGGGVFMLVTTAFNMTGGAITGNSAGEGAGGAFVENAPFDMTGGEITGNTAPTSGGVGLYSSATLTGNPSIGGTTSPGAGKGWIHGNTATNNSATNDVGP